MQNTRYEFEGPDGEKYAVDVQTSRRGAATERGRQASGGSTQVTQAAGNLEKELTAVTALAHRILDGLRRLKPQKVEVEFGVELGGKFGIPLLTEGSANANFKVTLTWEETK